MCLKPIVYVVAMAPLKLLLGVYFLWYGLNLGTLWYVNMGICIHLKAQRWIECDQTIENNSCSPPCNTPSNIFTFIEQWGFKCQTLSDPNNTIDSWPSFQLSSIQIYCVAFNIHEVRKKIIYPECVYS